MDFIAPLLERVSRRAEKLYIKASKERDDSKRNLE